MKMPHTEEVPDELFEAARVSRFMRPGRNGRWELRYFTRTEKEYEREISRARFTSDFPELVITRAVPPGDYITLRRQMIFREKEEACEEQFGEEIIQLQMEARGYTREQQIEHMCPPDVAWIPVMSDTPAEILEHDHALLNATGVVVITGLGLGCLPHALLTKPDVERIHIIEIDTQVIQLTGKYLKKHPKVTIHKGSALDIHKFLPRGTEVDYVWHDIWTHISSRNFHDSEAEHGISYQRLFDLYNDYLSVGDTSAWAYREATIQAEATEVIRQEQREFEVYARSLPDAEQAEALYEHLIRDKLTVGRRDPYYGRPLPDEVKRMLDPKGELRVHIRKLVASGTFWDEWDRTREERETTPNPLGRPNEHLENA